MRSYEHTHTADLSASLSCSAAVAEKVQDPAQHGSWSVSTTDAEEAGDIPASFKDMMRRLLERHEFIVIKNWEHDEFRALEEFCATHDLSYEVLAVSLFTKQMACRLR